MGKFSPIRCFEGSAEPYAAFWRWSVLDAAKDGEGGAQLDFIGQISEFSWLGDEVTPAKFAQDLETFGKGGPITIRMHSPGGEVFAAGAIASMLSAYKGKKTVVIEGLCASAAVMVALSADVVRISDTAYMMVHNPGYGSLYGWLDAETLRKFADNLVVFTDGMLTAYENRTGLGREVLAGLLDAETWMTAEQAVTMGFADEVIAGGGAKARPNELKNFVNVPGELLNVVDDQADALEREAESLRFEVDLSIRR